MQCNKEDGGLSLTNFHFDLWAFVLCLLFTWFDLNALVSWRPTEDNLALPPRLQDIVYSAGALKHAQLHLGTLISFFLTTLRLVEK
jgi:hypothetical protein